MTREETKRVLEIHLEHWQRLTKEKICTEQEGAETISALDMAIKALELVNDFERARIITGGRLNGRTQAYKCGLADGQRQTSWIPVSEKPQEGRYLCTYEHYDGKCIDFGSFDGEKWYIKPIAYMPLPHPYKGESAEWVDDKCSACGKGIEDLIDSSEWYRNESPRYCPFCGIKIQPYKEKSEEEE